MQPARTLSVTQQRAPLHDTPRGYIFSRMNRRRPIWTRSAFVAVVLCWALAAVVAQCWAPQLREHAGHSHYPRSASAGSGLAVSGNHAHLVDNSKSPCPAQAAIAVLPRVGTAPSDLAALPAATDPVGAQAYLAVPAGRGPPSGRKSPDTGQDLLTRFCLARR